jgi:hypothetical protein
MVAKETTKDTATLREMSNEEIRDVFKALNLPLAPPNLPAPKREPLILFHITGDSPPLERT